MYRERVSENFDSGNIREVSLLFDLVLHSLPIILGFQNFRVSPLRVSISLSGVFSCSVDNQMPGWVKGSPGLLESSLTHV